MVSENIKEFKNLLFEKASQYGFSDYEIFYTTKKEIETNIFKGDLEKFENSTSGGLSFRGLFNNKMGYAYSEKIDVSIIDDLLKNAKENSEILDASDNEQEEIFEGSKNYTELQTFFDNIEDIDVDTMIKKGLEIEKYILDYDPRITACDTCSLSKLSTELFLFNSKGLELTRLKNYLVIYASALAKQNPQDDTDEDVKSDYNIELFFDTSDLDTKEFAKSVATKTLACLNAKSTKSQEYDIVFSNEAFASLFSCFVSNFFAENVHKGFSLFKNKLNTQVASDKITIIEDPLMERVGGTTSFDSEGVACFKKEVVSKGELMTYLYNLKYAKKDGVASTGNGFKSGYKGKVSTSVANFYIKNGEISFDDLLKKAGNGILLTDLAGLHSGVNNISGDFSLLAKGFIIKDGVKDIPLEQITVSGNFFEVLKNIEDLSNDLKFELSGISSPSVYVGKLMIAGE